LEMAWADDIVVAAGVRLIAFDRPGYGGSTQASFTLASVARMAVELADQFGLDRFRTSGLSGGGPFALAAAALAGERVRAVGVMAGAGPFQLIPAALDRLSDGDKAAEKLLPGDPEGACAGFVEGFDMTPALASASSLYEAFEPLLSESDRRLWSDHSDAMFNELREAVRQGVQGCGWDNVAWIGSWDFDPATVECPVLLWYGTEDRMASPDHAHWFEQNLRNARLTMHEGEGHLLAFQHLPEMLKELLGV